VRRATQEEAFGGLGEGFTEFGRVGLFRVGGGGGAVEECGGVEARLGGRARRKRRPVADAFDCEFVIAQADRDVFGPGGLLVINLAECLQEVEYLGASEEGVCFAEGEGGLERRDGGGILFEV